MSKNENTEIAVQQGGTAIANVAVDRRGLEDVDLGSVVVPIAKLLQSTSPEVADESFADYNFKAGNLIHSLLLEKLPDNFIPLKIYDDKILFIPKNDQDKEQLKRKVKEKLGIELAPDDMNSMILCRSKDNKCGDRFGSCAACRLSEFDGTEKPFCSANINILALPEGMDMPLVVRFSNTSHKHGRQLKSVIFYAGGPIFKKKYKLVSTKKTDKGNSWYELSARPAGNVSDEEFAKSEAIYNQFLNIDVTAEEQQIESEVVQEF